MTESTYPIQGESGEWEVVIGLDGITKNK
jgi:hypothetical protein